MMKKPRLSTTLIATALAMGVGGALALAPNDASACGCFAPPDPTVPLVQAGERILFSQKDGVVTAHIQIQYQGKAGEFGWLLPLPAIPKNRLGKDGIDVGVDELFTTLINGTQPRYRMTRVYEDCGGGANRGSPNAASDSGGGFGGSGPPEAGPMSPLVLKDSVGPYDFAILKADAKDEMFKWLADNRYFVPAGTEGAVGPYIRKGAYFLALKLKAGQDTGDLQPVVLRYQSDLPMIPIVLTSVGANPNMGIQVWMLGKGRAIPRNYFHTVINDSHINWFTAGQNYNDVIIKAVNEASGKHSFVTEFAGGTPTTIRGQLDRPSRFSDLPRLATVADPMSFVAGLFATGFALNTQLTTILSRYIPLPKALADSKVTLAQYYSQINFYLGTDRQRNPDKYKDIEAALAAFPPAMVADELRTRIVEPTVDAGALLGDSERPYLTRLYTTLSPEDMNKDPVFSWNQSLPDYSNEHRATLTYHCSAGFFSNGRYSSATLVTESGWKMGYTVEEADRNRFTAPALPFSQRIETLREVGMPEVVVDNTPQIRDVLGGSGCSLSGAGSTGSRSGAAGLGLLSLSVFGVALSRRRRGR